MIYFFLKNGNFILETYLNEKVSKNKHKFPWNITCLHYSRFARQPVTPWSQNCESICMREEKKNKKQTKSPKVIVAQNFSRRTEPHGFTMNISLISTSDSLHTSFCFFYMQNHRFVSSANLRPNKQSIKQFAE